MRQWGGEIFITYIHLAEIFTARAWTAYDAFDTTETTDKCVAVINVFWDAQGTPNSLKVHVFECWSLIWQQNQLNKITFQ